MPMPPVLAKDLAYSSLRNERHTPAAPPPPNGPSPSTSVNIWLNIVLRNTDSKSTADLRALALASAGTFVSAGSLASRAAKRPREADPVEEARAGKGDK